MASAETKHTPGPWGMETVRTTSGLCHRVGPFPSPKSWRSDKPAHACIYDDYPPDVGSPELVANARLIAAAPDLLEALKACVTMYGDENPDDDWTCIKLARAAIAKAEGR